MTEGRRTELVHYSKGLIGAMVAMKNARGQSMYRHQFTPKRFTRMRAAMEAEVVALDRAYAKVEKDLRKIQSLIKEPNDG